MGISQNRNVVVGGTAALVVIAVIAVYFYVANYGVRKFDDYLYENNLRDSIGYRKASYSPISGTITLKDVDLDVVLFDAEKVIGRVTGFEQGFLRELSGGLGLIKKLTGNVKTLTIKDSVKKDRLTMKFKGYELYTAPTERDIERNFLYEATYEQLAMLNQMGIDETSLDGEFFYHYDRNKDNLSVGLGIDGESVAAFSMNLNLSRARRLVDSPISELLLSAITDPESLDDQLGRVEFVSMDAAIRDHGFLAKMAYLDAVSDFRYDVALSENAKFDALELYKVKQQDPDPLTASIDESSNKALREFSATGGNLKVAVQTKRPVRISDVAGDERLHRDVEVRVRR